MAIKIGDIQRQERRGTAAAATSANAILKAGEWGYETDTGKAKIGDGSTAWTSNLRYFIPITISVNAIAGASDVVYTLPDATGKAGKHIIKRRGAGTGKVTFTTVSSQTIDGLAPTQFELRGETEIVLYPNGGNWEQEIVVNDWVDVFIDYSATSITKTLAIIDGKYQVFISNNSADFSSEIIRDSNLGGTTTTGSWTSTQTVVYTHSTNVFTTGLAGYYIMRIQKWQDRVKIAGI